MSDRIFKITDPSMKGDDIDVWQHEVKKLFKKLNINCPIKPDGIYGVGTRSFTAALVHANGMSARTQMSKGVTPKLRAKLRIGELTPSQKKTKNSKAREEYRQHLRKQFANAGEGKVHRPVTKIVGDSWGYHPGVHDGLDVITQPDPLIFAMVKCQIIDVRGSGWWGLGAPSNPQLKARGDGIVQMKVLETVGPFKKGMHIGYGHAEKARVRVGQVVKAGEPVAHAGFANAWHIHMMVNTGRTSKGIGNVDPRPLLDYAVEHG